MTFNWGKKFTELQEEQGKLGTQKALISRSFIAHAIDQAKAEQREEDIQIVLKHSIPGHTIVGGVISSIAKEIREGK